MTAEPIPTRSLHRKLAQIMYEAERIPKNGKAPKEMGGYPFVQVGDAADFIRKALAEHVISMVPSEIEVVGQTDRPTKSGGTITTLDLRITWTLTDGESGETATIQSYGAGADVGDKYSGKATTNAMKYALLAGFLLSTGEDPELGNLPDRQKGENALVASQPRADAPLIGTAELPKDAKDLELRQSPEGLITIFRLTEGRKGIKVILSPVIAETAYNMRADWLGKRVSVWGEVTEESFNKSNGQGKVTPIHWQVVHASRLATPDWILPAPVTDSPIPTPDDEPNPAEQAAIDAELATLPW